MFNCCCANLRSTCEAAHLRQFICRFKNVGSLELRIYSCSICGIFIPIMEPVMVILINCNCLPNSYLIKTPWSEHSGILIFHERVSILTDHARCKKMASYWSGSLSYFQFHKCFPSEVQQPFKRPVFLEMKSNSRFSISEHPFRCVHMTEFDAEIIFNECLEFLEWKMVS